jgi:hypothetical protein
MPTARPETLEPEFLAQLGSIYDEAWASVAASYTHVDTHALADARAELAAIMMRLAADERLQGSSRTRRSTSSGVQWRRRRRSLQRHATAR